MWGAVQFNGVGSAAANVSRREAPYTSELFLADFPQFTGEDGAFVGPASILDQFVAQARVAISPDKWEAWRYACGLYVAHCLTLYLSAYAEHADSVGQAAATGALIGVVKSASLGDASVTYDTAPLTAATEQWGGLNATRYGQQLATEARLVGMGGMLAL